MTRNEPVPDAAPDSGEPSVPAAPVDAMIEAGHSGIGTYVENAYAIRLTGECEETSRGEVCLGTRSHGWRSVDTEPE